MNNNVYTIWLDCCLGMFFLEVLETLKACEIAEQYARVTERIKKFHRRPDVMTFIDHWKFGLI